MPYLVCGFFTRDAVYTPWADRLKANLDQHGIPHDIRSVDPVDTGKPAPA